ncbi:MAG: hypothetical protein WCD79_11645 [Chthoniobacteraceae bacterium]
MRKFIFLIIIAAAVWYGYQHMGQKTDGTQQPATTSPAPQAASTFFPTPTPTLASTCRPALLSLSRTIFKPLDADDAIPQDDAGKKLLDLKPTIASLQSDPDYTRTVQAYAWIDQALKERAGFMTRMQQDKVNAVGAVKTPTTAKSTASQIEAQNKAQEASFFANATANQWKSRASYYQPMIEQLLATGR